SSVYLSSTAASHPAPSTLSNMTIGLLGSLNNGSVVGGTLNLDGVNIGATSTIVTGIGHNLIYAQGSVVNYGTIEAAGTSSSDGVAIVTGTGSSFTNAGLIEAVGGLDPATIGSYSSPASTFINNGTLEANGTLTGSSPSNAGELVINDYITASAGSSGTILMTNGGIVELKDSAAANQTLLFGTNGGTLDLSTTADVSSGVLIPTLTGFGYLSAIDLTGSLFSSFVSESLITTGTNTTLVVSEGTAAGNYTSSFSLVFAGHPQNLTFTNNATVTLDGANQSAIVITAPCFAEGTRILTPRGEIPVEALQIGDHIITIHHGTPRHAAIRWRGQRRVSLAQHPAPERVAPIIIEPGALGEATPHRRLALSPDHALLLDGLLIEAKNLVNGTTIRQDFNPRSITYHHLELDQHSAVLAEGAAAETYLESGNRHQFEGQSALAMIADFAATQPVPRFAPLCDRGPAVTAIRQRLAAIAIAAGYRIAHASAANPSGLIIEADGQIIHGEPKGAGRVLFTAPATLRRVRLHAPSGVPAEIDPAATDRRRLSLALRGLAYGGQDLALDDHCFAAGFFAPEGAFRWAGPEAILDFAHLAPASQLTLLVHDFAPHWVAPQHPCPLKVA
ncbi:MAG: Hint domain-containing protein, partial [Acidiphilium sp.]